MAQPQRTRQQRQAHQETRETTQIAETQGDYR